MPLPCVIAMDVATADDRRRVHGRLMPLDILQDCDQPANGRAAAGFAAVP